MALNIGATTTLFSLVYGVLMRPLPWPDADRVVRLKRHAALSVHDAFSFVAVLVLLVAVAVVACVAPAWRVVALLDSQLPTTKP
jgi:hypothetical protein